MSEPHPGFRAVIDGRLEHQDRLVARLRTDDLATLDIQRGR